MQYSCTRTFVLACKHKKTPAKLTGVIFKNGTPTGTRTQDPMIKSHLLYQLSYGRTLCAIRYSGLRD